MGEATASEDHPTRLNDGVTHGDYAFAGVGRAIANPDRAIRVRNGEPLRPFDRSMLESLD